MNILKEITEHKKQILEKQKKEIPQDKLLKLLRKPLALPRFKDKISQNGIHLIAEIKKASPSAGVIRQDFDPAAIAESYDRGGASCLSVLTEDKYFLGSLQDFMRVRKAVSLPLLRKDFIMEDYQIYESKVCGADAILLIAGLLSDNQINNFLELSSKLKLDVVLEVHDDLELKRALDSKAEIIGINSRNLKDFSVDLKGVLSLIKKIPKGRLIICESGVKTIDDLAFLKNLKINGVLVGEALMSSKRIESQTKSFVDFLEK